MAVEQLVLPTLIPMPIVEEPFCRVATDIVGLLHCSQKGHRYYILVVCDYATRYLKALIAIAEHIPEELVSLLSQVRIP